MIDWIRQNLANILYVVSSDLMDDWRKIAAKTPREAPHA